MISRHMVLFFPRTTKDPKINPPKDRVFTEQLQLTIFKLQICSSPICKLQYLYAAEITVGMVGTNEESKCHT